jgi:hypothetical protein
VSCNVEGSCFCEGHQESWARKLAAEDKAEADAQALADVRTLDEWRRANRLVRQVVVGSRWARVLCQLQQQGDDVVAPFVADSEDEARAKAAAWVREQKS